MKIDPTGSLPWYAQVVQTLAAEIATDAQRPGDRLPRPASQALQRYGTY